MSYTAEFYKFRKSGKNKGKYLFHKKIEIDHISELVVGSFLKLVNRNGNEHKFYVDRREHIYYDGNKEYYLQYFIREVKE